MKDKKILIAKITSPHGIKGHVKLMSYAQNPEDIFQYENISDSRKNHFKIKLLNLIPSKENNFFVVKIDGVNDRNKAEELRSVDIFIDRDDLKEIDEGEFYYVDLIGLEARNGNGQKIGVVKNVGDFGAGGVIEIEFTNTFDEKQSKTQVFSFNDQMVPEVNIQDGYLILYAPEAFEVNSINK